VLPGGKLVVVESGYLAGSWHFTDHCIGSVIRFAGVSLGDAVDMASARPRELLRLPPRTLEVGQPAELVLFDWEEGSDFRVHETLTVG
jgi:N-acetylglucosamine-6-phosphate deacetylase